MQPLPTSLVRALFHPWAWRMAWRDSRSQRGRLALYAVSIAVGICALTAIHALRASVRQSLDTQTKNLLGTDVLVSSRQPIAQDPLVNLSSLITETGSETAFSSMLSDPSGAHSRLVQVRALEGGFPFGTTVDTVPVGAWQSLQEQHGILLDPALLAEFDVHPGDKLKLGATEFTVLGEVTKGVPRSNRFSGFASEAFIRLKDLPSTGLAGSQSLVFHHLFLELRPGTEAERKAALAEVRKSFSLKGVQIQTPEDRSETFGEGIDKAKEFLSITALTALVLGGIGVAGAIHTHIRRRVPTVAVLLCLGCPASLAFAVYMVQAATLGLMGTVLGAGLGAFAHAALVHFAGNSRPFKGAAMPQPLVILETAGAGFLLCCGFALLPLLRIRDISPTATLNARSEKVPGRSLREAGVYLLLFGLVWSVARLNGANSLRALALTASLGVAFASLTATAFGLMKFTRWIIRPSWPYLLRQGVSNLFRPQNQTLLFLLSLGLGTFLLLTTWFTQSLVLSQLKIDNGPSTPNLYLVDVQPDQTRTVRAVFEAEHLPVLEDAPMVTMRIESVKGLLLSAIEKQPQNASSLPEAKPTQRVPRWVMEREYRSTYRTTLNATETVLAGAWPPTPFVAGAPVPISLEQQLAKDLKVGVGDEIVLDVQGVPLQAVVACVRKVDWSKFNLNFFMVFPPGVLEDAPQFHLLTTRVPSGQTSGALQRTLLRAAPNVSVVDLTSILATVASLLQKAARVIQLLAGFTLAAGLPILAGALLNGRDQRLRESVLLRTLGASEQQVRAIVLVEYAALGALSELAGSLLAVGAQWAAARWIFKTPHAFETGPVLVALAISIGGSVLAGRTLSRSVCSKTPLDVLRQG